MSSKQRFLHQPNLLDIDSVKAFAPNKWINHSSKIDHPFNFKKKEGLAKRKLSNQFLYIVIKGNELENLAIANGLNSDIDESSNISQ